jgi:hypothetical protein
MKTTKAQLEYRAKFLGAGARIALNEKADAAWSNAWDRARDADERAGRPYNKGVYAERAHVARIKVLGVCQRARCVAHKAR